MMTVRSPADGIVFYGACVHGQWPHAADLAQKLRPGGSLTPHEVLLTIVSPSSLFARVTVPEKELHDMAVGLGGNVRAHRLSRRANSGQAGKRRQPGRSRGEIYRRRRSGRGRADQTGPAQALPSMNGSLKVTVYSKVDALTVPAKSVFNEGADDSQHYVYLSVDGKSVRRDVKVGRRTEAHVEILDGLKAEDVVLVKKPDDE